MKQELILRPKKLTGTSTDQGKVEIGKEKTQMKQEQWERDTLAEATVALKQRLDKLELLDLPALRDRCRILESRVTGPGKERFHEKVESRTDWEVMAWEVCELMRRLRKKPIKKGYQLNIGGILNAYREGDLDFDQSVEELRLLLT